MRLYVREDATSASPEQEIVMTDAADFRQYAKEALRDSSVATSESEKQTLTDIACIWAQAALSSERVFGSGFVSPPHDVGVATPPTRSGTELQPPRPLPH
jgi:hypothetical protein